LISRSSTFLRFARTAFVGAAVVLCAAAVDLGAREESKDWVVLENCRLIVNSANDGDSFHASVANKEYIFRLYLVDAPETDALTPARLVEQAKYFQITVPQVIEVAEAAKEFAREKLSQPFTVFTRMSDAMGRSKLERFYALVQTKEGDLGEQLVRNGLARNYGYKAVPPGLPTSRVEVEKLQQFEDEARQEKIGGWGVDVGRLNARAQTPAAFSVFVVEKGTQARGTTPQVGTARRVVSRTLSGPRGVLTKEKTPLGQIDINSATEKELEMIPGIGAKFAARIIAARPFRSADDLKKVNGIGDKKFARIRPYFQ
jgi:competence ComEA-like helix-hairpin-helix protein